MRKIKLILGLLIICLFTLVLSSCVGNVYKTRSSGYFRYMVDSETKEAMLVGLTEEGEQQETIIIPSQIDGYKLTTIGYPVVVGPGMNTNYQIDMKSDKLKELYIPSSIKFYSLKTYEFYQNLNTLNNIFIGDNSYSILMRHRDYNYNFQMYISNENMSNNYETYTNSYGINGKIDYSYLTIANVVYYLNDDTEDSYFVDDCDNEKIVNIPTDPVRDGYEFKGWYKEKECINKWDFENDIVPEKQYDENNEYIFIETSLYAKWESKK